MCKRMLRSVLAVAFSTGLVFGTVSTLDLGWDIVRPAGHADSALDLGWDITPRTSQTASGQDLGWDIVRAGARA